MAGVAHEADDGGDIDDTAGALADEFPDEGAGAEEAAFEVGIDDRVPVFVAHAHEEAVAGDAGVIDEDIDAAPFLEDGFGGLLDVGCVGDVGGDGEAASAGFGDFLGGFFGVGGSAGDAGDVGTFGGEFEGDGLADASAGSGYDGDLVVK
ncbi:MAG: hypothetical protein RI897_3034 [Verrucomicrobiota bacterium]